MKFEEMQRLKVIIATVSAYYGRQLTDAAVTMYAEDLSDFSVDEVSQAIRSYRSNTKNRTMFLPAHIVEILRPTPDNKDLARETAMRINQAVSRFGYMRSEEAMAFIGETGWLAVERFGGWTYLCQNLGVSIDVNSFIAQARDLVEAQLKLEEAGIDTDLPAIEQSKGRVFDIAKKLAEAKTLKIDGEHE